MMIMMKIITNNNVIHLIIRYYNNTQIDYNYNQII